MIPHSPILAIFIPLFTAFLMPLMGIAAKKYKIKFLKEGFAVAMVLLELIVVFSMVPDVQGGVVTYWLGNWQPPVGITLAIDGLGLLTAMIIAGISALVVVYSVTYMKREGGLSQYYTLIFLLMGGMMGIALTGDLFNLYVFFEIMSISSYALVAFRRKWQSIEASIKYMIVGSLGTSFILIGITLLYGMAGTLTMAHLMPRLALLPASSLLVPLVFIIVGVGIKLAIIPLHMWLPDAYQSAPSSISALFSGASAAVGVYTMIRIVYMIFNTAGVGLMLAGLGVVTMVVGALMALMQKDLKRLLAYSGISQMGYILLGVGVGTALGIQGGLFHMLNNALYKTMLFLIAGAIIYRVGTSNMDRLGGLWKNMPITAILFTIGALAISGVPPFNGFASKWMIYIAGVEAGGIGYAFTAIAILTSALTLAYFIKAINSIFLGQRPKNLAEIRETPRLLLVPIVILGVLCVVFGILPQLGVDFVRPAQEAVMNTNGYITTVLGGV